MLSRGGSRAAGTSKMECLVIIVNGFKRSISKRSILDVAAVLNPPLLRLDFKFGNVAYKDKLFVFHIIR